MNIPASLMTTTVCKSVEMTQQLLLWEKSICT